MDLAIKHRRSSTGDQVQEERCAGPEPAAPFPERVCSVLYSSSAGGSSAATFSAVWRALSVECTMRSAQLR